MTQGRGVAFSKDLDTFGASAVIVRWRNPAPVSNFWNHNEPVVTKSTLLSFDQNPAGRFVEHAVANVV